MLLPYCLILTIAFAFLLYHSQQPLILSLSLLISLLYYSHQLIIAKTHSWSKLFKGDLVYLMGYIAWCYIFQMNYFLYLIPLMLGDVGRLYVMTVHATGQVSTIAQQLIMFQNQTQTYILLTLALELLTLSPIKLYQFLVLAILLKLKYMFYMPSRKAFNEMHFFFDRLSRHLNLRSVYHVVYEGACWFGNDLRTPISSIDIYY